MQSMDTKHMEPARTIPLFVLPMGLFPHTVEPLRVFEPRYKQMLDDCVLSDSPFGYVAADPEATTLDGWSPPSEYGVFCLAEDVNEQGTNLVFSAHGDARFRIHRIIPAALPAENFGDVFPTVDDLVDSYSDTNPEGKLYLRAEVEEMPPLVGGIEDTRWENFVQSWAEYLVMMDALLRASGLGLEEVIEILRDEFANYSESGMWTACQSILTEHDERQSALSALNANDVMSILEQSINNKKIQMDFIQSMLDAEE